MRPYIYDCPIGNCGPHPTGVNIKTLDKNTLHAEKLTVVNTELLRICNSITDIAWGDFKGFAGRPQGDTRSQLQEMLKLDLPSCKAVRDIFDKKETIRNFYKP